MALSTGSADLRLTAPEALGLLQALACDLARRNMIRLLVVKGASLAHHGLRPAGASADVDVLVPPSHAEQFLESMSTIGWYARLGRFNDYPVPNHSVTLIHDDWPIDLDVHRTFPGFLKDPEQVFDVLWGRREQMEVAHFDVDIPDFSSSVLVLALHSARSRMDNPRHTRELRHLITLAADWSPATREDVSRLAVETGCSQSLETVLARMDISAGLPDGASPAELRHWNDTIQGRSSSLRAWWLSLAAQPVHLWPRLLWEGIWPSEEYLRATSRVLPEETDMNAVRRRRLSEGARRIGAAVLVRVGFRRTTPVSQATEAPSTEAGPPQGATDGSGSLVSVVIPVYDSAPFLRECLASVLGQTYQSLEVLCVDDGSGDGSAEVLDEVASKDPRVRVIHQRHLGVGVARNAGIRAARGELLTFVDSDDVVDEALVGRLVAALGDADLAMCGWRGEERTMTGAQAITEGLRHGYLNTTGKLMRTSTLHGDCQLFDEGLPIREDIVFNVTHLLVAKRVRVIPDALYHHRPRPGSLTTSFRPAKHDELTLADERLASLTRELHTPRFRSLLNYLRIRSLISAGLNLGHPDSSVPAGEARRRQRVWQREAGPLPVRHGDCSMRAIGLAYRLSGLPRITTLIARLRQLRQLRGGEG